MLSLSMYHLLMERPDDSNCSLLTCKEQNLKRAPWLLEGYFGPAPSQVHLILRACCVLFISEKVLNVSSSALAKRAHGLLVHCVLKLCLHKGGSPQAVQR